VILKKIYNIGEMIREQSIKVVWKKDNLRYLFFYISPQTSSRSVLKKGGGSTHFKIVMVGEHLPANF